MAAENREISDGIAYLLEELRDPIATLFRRFGIQPWDAEDILQEALIVMIGRWDIIDGKEGYLLGIVRYKCLYFLRRKYKRRAVCTDPAILDTFPGQSAQEKHELRLDFLSLTTSLPSRQRKAIRLRRLGKTYREIAAEIPGCNKQIVFTDILKAIARLQVLARQAEQAYSLRRLKVNHGALLSALAPAPLTLKARRASRQAPLRDRRPHERPSLRKEP